MRYLLDVLYFLALLLGGPWLWRRRRSAIAWRERCFGPYFLNRHPLHALTGNSIGAAPISGSRTRPRVWLHGVSMGEIHALRRLVAEIQRQRPDVQCLLSSSTDTGLSEALRCFPECPVFRWPFDFSWSVERFLDRIRPDLIVLAESEWWPNFLLAAQRRRVPVVAANVRLSPRSQKRYRRLAPLARIWLRGIDRFLVQSAEYRDALIACGIQPDRIAITGSLKFDGNAGDRQDRRVVECRCRFGLAAEELVWVAGSTQPDENEAILDVYTALASQYPQLRVILVPRNPECFELTAQRLVQRGIPFVRRTRLPPPEQIGRSLILVDTIGELSVIWGLADIAFVGGSLDGRRGGQNMIEPASYGAAVLFGPHTWNFRETVRRLVESRAAREVRDAAELCEAVRELIEQPERRQQLGTAARRLVESQQGASRRIVDALSAYLPVSRDCHGDAA